MNISVIGAGYVGLTTAACLAELGHSVFCAECDTQKLAKLEAGDLPFFEPYLEEMVARNRASGRLHFGSTETAIERGQAIFICVGTPPLENGEADLSFIESVAVSIAKRAEGYRLVIEKSTVPVQTGIQLRRHLAHHRNPRFDYDVASNPEFLREGSAVENCTYRLSWPEGHQISGHRHQQFGDDQARFEFISGHENLLHQSDRRSL
jgi:UDPglucose 6-dehydrogenase